MRKKQPRGVRPLADGRFEIRSQFVDPKTGRMRDLMRTVEAKSLAEAAYLREKLRDDWLAARTNAPRSSRARFGEAIAAWLEQKKISPSTRERYATAIARWGAVFGDYWLDAVTPHDVREVLEGWRENGLEAETINGRLRVLRTFAHETSNSTAVAQVKILQRTHSEEEDDEDEGRGLDVREFRAWLDALDVAEFSGRRGSARMWRPLLRLAAWTGMRFGEISALEWRDVDLEAGTVRVRRAQWRGLTGKPKAAASKRIVTIPTDVIDELRAYRRELQVEHESIAIEGLVFGSRESESGHISNTGVRKNMLRVSAIAAGCTAKREAEWTAAALAWLDDRPALYCLRHTMNNLLRQSTPELVRQAMIGHADDSMNARYSKVEVTEKRAATAAVVAMVRGRKQGGD